MFSNSWKTHNILNMGTYTLQEKLKITEDDPETPAMQKFIKS